MRPAARALTARQVAAELGVHRETVIEEIARGRLRGYRVGTRWRIDRAALDEYKARPVERTATPAPTNAPRRARFAPLRFPNDTPHLFPELATGSRAAATARAASSTTGGQRKRRP